MPPTSPGVDPVTKVALPLAAIEHLNGGNIADGRATLVSKIQQLSERLFPGRVTFEHAVDPEDPTNACTVFDVTAKGEFADYRDRIFQWHDEVEKIVGSAVNEFRVIVHPQ